MQKDHLPRKVTPVFYLFGYQRGTLAKAVSLNPNTIIGLVIAKMKAAFKIAYSAHFENECIPYG